MNRHCFTPILMALTVFLLAFFGASFGQNDGEQPMTVREKIADARYKAQVEVVNRLLRDYNSYDYHELGSRLKGKGEYAEAAIYYIIALKLKPKRVSTMYELACNCSLWGQNDLALGYLAEAIDGGFWGHALMQDDAQLEPLHGEPLYEELLSVAKRRYKEQAEKHRGSPVVEIPTAKPPADGWPAILMLHGYGASSSQFWQVAKNAASLGFVAICPAGPRVLYEKSFAWPADDIAKTHTHLQQALDAVEVPVDRRRLFLAGVSQGGHHAALLLAEQPGTYSGALVIDPEGWLPAPVAISSPGAKPRLFLVTGEKVPMDHRDIARSLKGLWQDGSLPFAERSHSGNVGIPSDWRGISTEAFGWLRGEGGGR